MANHAFADCRGAEPGALYSACVEALKAGLGRFEGTARIVEDREDGIAVALFLPDGNAPICEVGFRRSGCKVEWRHPADLTLSWWFAETVAAIAARGASERLGNPVFLTDEGIGGRMKPDYDVKYPRLPDWVRAIDPTHRDDAPSEGVSRHAPTATGAPFLSAPHPSGMKAPETIRAAGSYERAAEDVANAGDADALASALGRFRTARRAFARLLLARDRERRPHLYRHAL